MTQFKDATELLNNHDIPDAAVLPATRTNTFLFHHVNTKLGVGQGGKGWQRGKGWAGYK